MMLLTDFVYFVLVILEIGEEEAEKRIPAEHIADIIMANHYKGKRADIELVSSCFYKSLYSICENGKKIEGIEPHNVILIGNNVCGKCIKHREKKNLAFVRIACMLVKIKAECETAKPNLDNDYRKQGKEHQ